MGAGRLNVARATPPNCPPGRGGMVGLREIPAGLSAVFRRCAIRLQNLRYRRIDCR